MAGLASWTLPVRAWSPVSPSKLTGLFIVPVGTAPLRPRRRYVEGKPDHLRPAGSATRARREPVPLLLANHGTAAIRLSGFADGGRAHSAVVGGLPDAAASVQQKDDGKGDAEHPEQTHASHSSTPPRVHPITTAAKKPGQDDRDLAGALLPPRSVTNGRRCAEKGVGPHLPRAQRRYRRGRSSVAAKKVAGAKLAHERACLIRSRKRPHG